MTKKRKRKKDIRREGDETKIVKSRNNNKLSAS